MQQLERTYLDCACDSHSHIIRFTYDPDDGSLFAEMNLVDYLPWYKRVWVGFQYALGILKPAYNTYDITIVKPGDYDKLLEIVNKAKSFQSNQ